MTKTGKRRKKNCKPHPVRDWLGYAAVRVLLSIMYLFGVNANLRFARFLGRVMWKCYHRGRERALGNLRRSFPEKDEQWCIETGRRSFEQIVMMVIDVFFTSRLINRDNCYKFGDYKNLERAKWIMQEGQGLLMLTAHYGNFEILGYLLGLFGFNIYSIARPLDNKYMNDYLLSLRKHTGQKIIDKKGATDKMEDIVNEHASVGFIADQDAGKKGVFVDFFGKKASTYKSIALLAMQYDMPVTIASSKRVGDKFFFEVEIHRIIFPAEWKERDDPLRWITQEYVMETEKFIRQDPSQYWWLHRRWKHRPREERIKNVPRRS